MLMSIIILFFPGVIAVSYYSRISNKEKNYFESFMQWVEFTFLINMINLIILYLRGHKQIDFTGKFNTDIFSTQFLVKYMIISFVLALLISYIKNLLSRNTKSIKF